VTNLLLHLASVVLLFVVLTRMTGKLWQSGFVAALFAIHPLHAESVAWVAERKDVLSSVFWILTMGAYVRYVEQKAAALGQSRVQGKAFFHDRRVWYALMLLAYTLGLMSKPMLVTLPFVLLLLDYWPLGRLRTEELGKTLPSLLFEKAPLFCLSAASSTITFIVQQGAGAVQTGRSCP